MVRKFGPKFFNLNENEIACVAIGRNMSYYLDYFYEYHRDIGVTHFLYIDNDSSDCSLERLSRWKNAIVLSSNVNFKEFQLELRRIAVQKYIGKGWRLAIDPDELFEFAGASKMNLVGLTKLLKEKGQTCVVAQMLDLVSNVPIHKADELGYEETVKKSKYYQTSNIKSYEYFSTEVPFYGLLKSNSLTMDSIQWKYGGIRNTYFGEDCLLTKHALFYFDSNVRSFVHPHFSTGLVLSDFTALLKHYKFAGNFIERETSLLNQDYVCPS
jgi:Glycosyl transferase family 2